MVNKHLVTTTFLLLVIAGCGFIKYSVNGLRDPIVYLADGGNQRILAWRSFPTTTQQPADLVLGQPNMNVGTANQCACATPDSFTMRGPAWLDTDGRRLFMADFVNNRVLIWNTLPTITNQPADIVLGQSVMTTSSINSGGISASSLWAPTISNDLRTNDGQVVRIRRFRSSFRFFGIFLPFFC